MVLLFKRFPIDVQAANKHLAGGVHDLRPITALRVEARQPGEVTRRKRLPAQSTKNRVRTGLDKHPAAHLGSSADAVGEPDCFPDMTHPIAWIQNFITRFAARNVRDQPQYRLAKGYRSRHSSEFLEHRLHQRRVEGVRNCQLAGGNSFCAEKRHHSFGRGAFSGDDGFSRTVYRRDGQLFGPV